ncbi:hypothetical protein C5167_011553 [Papaver somniferum]|uniref:Uncharacterized protein n=1 Tax=Papaver somniferum TaxID=3469 RepID=A0A4Y7K7A1_PAPSO|nr:hypothetical protein C5167_011553 [Papaver somniferum]
MPVLDLVSPVTEIFKCLLPPILLQIGYLVRHRRKIEKLGKKVDNLKNLRIDLQVRVDAARRNLESIRRVVQVWLERVDKEISKDETMERLMSGQALEALNSQSCFSATTSCGSSRYTLGCKIERKTIIIEELLEEGKSFRDISDPNFDGIDFLPANPDFESFASRKIAIDAVMDALKDQGTSLIGVYGMGGVGKTMLMTEVSKRVQEEKLFDVVVMANVSQNVDLKKIQATIAEVLGLERIKKMEDTRARAAMLSARLMDEKSVLVILDDVWTQNLNLSDVGIPRGHKGCKVAITTRMRIQVCNSWIVDKNIEVGVLTEEESWDLFKKNVGDSPDTQLELARHIANECKGLPIALVTLGRALRNKDNLLWEDTALQLKNATFSYIEGMDSQVFSSIKLSYDYLGNDIFKKYFLLCCLFPEDYRINVDHELMMYVICDDELLEVDNLKQARGRLHTILDKLVGSCLLSRNEKNVSLVWMHDIVRDVAISIACGDNNGFFVKAGMRLKVWPKVLQSRRSSNVKRLRLSLMRNQISALPEQPELPRLLSLSLEGNEPLKKIPDSAFVNMRSVEILDVRSTGISSLPSSLPLLVNLRTLFLDFCNFDHCTDISLVGKLKELVILSLQGCKLRRLPEDIGELTNLKLLNLSFNESLEVPPNVISRLSQLEELYMIKSFTAWEVDGWENKNKASLAELTSIHTLTTLHFSLLKDDPLGDRRRLRLDVTFGQRTGSDYRFCHNFCELMVSPPPLCDLIKVLMERVEKLSVRNSKGLKTVAELVPSNVGFKKMNSLHLQQCDEMEYLMSAKEGEEDAEIPPNAFIVLEELIICSMQNLKEIIHGPIPAGLMDKLKRVIINNCEKLTSVFASTLANRVPNLDELRLEGCAILKDIFNLETEPISQEEVVVTFSKLRKIYLQDLPSLETIWKGVIPHGCLGNLQILDLYSCEKLKYLFSTAISCSLKQLQELTVLFCLDMEKLIEADEEMFEDSLASTEIVFPNLETLIVSHCQNLEQLWDGRGSKNVTMSDKKPVLLPKLLKLELSNLPALSCLNQGSSYFDCPSLQHLQVVGCDNLKGISLSHQRTPKLEKIVGYSEDWFQSFEWEKPGDSLAMRHLFQVRFWPPHFLFLFLLSVKDLSGTKMAFSIFASLSNCRRTLK